MKKCIIVSIAVILLGYSQTCLAQMGNVGTKSRDIEVEFFGHVKTYPTFMSNLDFNDNDTPFDRILDENGFMADHNIRNEIRFGWLGRGDKWDFLIALEADFNLSKAHADRGKDLTQPEDSGFTGESFGVEKLNFGYDFGPFKIITGWADKFLDIQSGGVLYGDDHPYIGFNGRVGDNFSWEALYLIIQDDTTTDAIGAIDADTLDWRAYTFKGIYELPRDFALSPFYAYSDNDESNTADAKVHYLGVEGYGKLGLFTPRFELVWATGETDVFAATGRKYDINAYAAYGSVDINLSPAFNPYFGATFMTGDDNPNDDNIDAFNGITNISRYTPTFGMENAIIYRFVPVLGSHLYSNNFANLPKVRGNARTPGYGGISNTSSGDSPGLISYGLGAKGSIGKLSYKTQALYMTYEDEGALEVLEGKPIDDEVGIEFDLLLTYEVSKHFSIGNCFSVFSPGDAIQDIWGDEFDEVGFLETVELQFRW